MPSVALIRLCTRLPGWWRSLAALLVVVLSAGAARAAAVPVAGEDDPQAQTAPLSIDVVRCIAVVVAPKPQHVPVERSDRPVVSLRPAAPALRQGSALGPRAP